MQLPGNYNLCSCVIIFLGRKAQHLLIITAAGLMFKQAYKLIKWLNDLWPVGRWCCHTVNADFDTGWRAIQVRVGACVLLRSTVLVKTDILNWAACAHMSVRPLFFLLLCVALPPPCVFPHASLPLPACSCIAINSRATVPYFWGERDGGRRGRERDAGNEE